MTDIQQLIKELNTMYTNFKFTKAGTTFKAEAIINIRCKEGTEDLAYYGGDSCGYCSLGSSLVDIEKHIKASLPEYKVIDFIDGNRKCHFELYK